MTAQAGGEDIAPTVLRAAGNDTAEFVRIDAAGVAPTYGVVPRTWYRSGGGAEPSTSAPVVASVGLLRAVDARSISPDREGGWTVRGVLPAPSAVAMFVLGKLVVEPVDGDAPDLSGSVPVTVSIGADGAFAGMRVSGKSLTFRHPERVPAQLRREVRATAYSSEPSAYGAPVAITLPASAQPLPAAMQEATRW